MIDPDRYPTRDRLHGLAALPPLPDPGCGSTATRFAALADVNRSSLSLGRLFEGHADAVSILHDAGWAVPRGPGAVWASEDPRHPVRVERDADTWVVTGPKSFCSGASLVRWALVTARLDGEGVLVLVHLDHPRGVVVDPSGWVGSGMVDADTAAVWFDATPVHGVVGAPGWYLARPGFWHGAVGVAACWFGGALGVLHTMRAQAREEKPHEMALLGEAEAETWAMGAALEHAATEIDRDPADPTAARRRALLVRAVVERGCRQVLDAAAVALGPRPLAFDRDHSQRVADLQVYLRQHHGRSDLEELGRAPRGESWDGFGAAIPNRGARATC